MRSPDMESSPHKIVQFGLETGSYESTRYEGYSGLNPYDEVKVDPVIAEQVKEIARRIKEETKGSMGRSLSSIHDDELFGVSIGKGSDFEGRPDTVQVEITHKMGTAEGMHFWRRETLYDLYPNGQGIRRHIYSVNRGFVVEDTVLDEEYIHSGDLETMDRVFDILAKRK